MTTSPLPCAPRYKSTSPEAAVFVERKYALPDAFVSFKPSPAPEVVAPLASNTATLLAYSFSAKPPPIVVLPVNFKNCPDVPDAIPVPPLATGSTPVTWSVRPSEPPIVSKSMFAWLTVSVTSPPMIVSAPPPTVSRLLADVISSSDVAAVPPFAIGSVPDTSAVKLASPTDHVPLSSRATPVVPAVLIPVPPYAPATAVPCHVPAPTVPNAIALSDAEAIVSLPDRASQRSCPSSYAK